MRAQAVCKVTLKRLINPFYWGLILLLCALWNLVPMILGLGMPRPGMALSPLYWSLLILMVFPMPWQWSGDDRPLASFARGLAQAIVWGFFWVAVIVGLVIATHTKGISPPPAMQNPGCPPMPALSSNPKPIRVGARPLPRGNAVATFLYSESRPILAGVSVMGLGLLAGWVLANKERAEAGEQEAKQATVEARMHVLQSQMNPHVLFNAISGLSEMVREEPEAAEQALVNLSGFLRDLLDYGARNRAPLSQERTMVERYLSVERIRLGKRLGLTWEWDPLLENQELPPLMLQPLVENALKHGIAPHRGGGEVRIRLARVGDALELEVANTGAGLANPIKEGVGLRNLRERLAFFDPTSTLSLSREGDWTRASLRLGRQP